MNFDIIERNVDTNLLSPIRNHTGAVDYSKNSDSTSNWGRDLVIGSIILVGVVAYEGNNSSQKLDNIINKSEYQNRLNSDYYEKNNLVDYLNTKKKEVGLSFTPHSLIEEILSFKSLCNNWDGYGAIPLEIKAATNAIKIATKLRIEELNFLKDVFPNPNGTISFLFENRSDEVVSLEIGNSKMNYYVKLNSGNISFNDDKSIDDTEINKLIKQIAVL